MLFHDSKDESAWGLALVGAIVVTMAIVLGNVTANVQPKPPMEPAHTDVSSPYLHENVAEPLPRSDNASPYPQPRDTKK